MGCCFFHLGAIPWHNLKCFLFMVITVASCLNLVTSVSAKKSDNTNSDLQPSVAEVLTLTHQCTHRYLAIEGKKVRAWPRPTENSKNIPHDYNMILIKSVGFDGEVTLQSNKSLSYLCFNRRGKLTIRDKLREDLCLFQEVYNRDHTYSYHLRFNHNWLVGFRQNGKKLPGGTRTGKATNVDCYRFQKPDERTRTSDSNLKDSGSHLGSVPKYQSRRDLRSLHGSSSNKLTKLFDPGDFLDVNLESRVREHNTRHQHT